MDAINLNYISSKEIERRLLLIGVFVTDIIDDIIALRISANTRGKIIIIKISGRGFNYKADWIEVITEENNESSIGMAQLIGLQFGCPSLYYTKKNKFSKQFITRLMEKAASIEKVFFDFGAYNENIEKVRFYNLFDDYEIEDFVSLDNLREVTITKEAVIKNSKKREVSIIPLLLKKKFNVTTHHYCICATLKGELMTFILGTKSNIFFDVPDKIEERKGLLHLPQKKRKDDLIGLVLPKDFFKKNTVEIIFLIGDLFGWEFKTISHFLDEGDNNIIMSLSDIEVLREKLYSLLESGESNIELYYK